MSDVDALTAAETIASAVALCIKALGILRVSEHSTRDPTKERQISSRLELISTMLSSLGDFISIYKPNTTSKDVVLTILKRSHGNLQVVAQTVERIWQPRPEQKARFFWLLPEMENLSSLLEKTQLDLSLMASLLSHMTNQQSLELLQILEPELQAFFGTSEEQQLRAKSRATIEAGLRRATSTNSLLSPDTPKIWTKEVLQRILSETLPAQVKVITNSLQVRSKPRVLFLDHGTGTDISDKEYPDASHRQ